MVLLTAWKTLPVAFKSLMVVLRIPTVDSVEAERKMSLEEISVEVKFTLALIA